MIRSAVILAAGRGARLGALGEQRPKGFIELGGEAIIETSLARLRRAGVVRVCIVTGHLDGFYRDLAGRHPEVTLIHNPDYAASGSMYSLYLARAAVQEDFLLLESDLIYEQRALTALLAAAADTLLVSGPTGSGDEVYVEASKRRLTGLSKRRADLAGEVIGELTGLTRLTPAALAAMCRHAETVFAASLHLEYEQALVAAARETPVACLLIPDLAWSEIDDAAHLARAVAQVFPAIQANDRRYPS
ncbi:MAG: phosphocholine cytidylyltransferase family protein [Betaproteobacteria bacterium]|nr:phosphocholine cytidylyltransferase family protein [Betaproteobacteria bacterium]